VSRALYNTPLREKKNFLRISYGTRTASKKFLKDFSMHLGEPTQTHLRSRFLDADALTWPFFDRNGYVSARLARRKVRSSGSSHWEPSPEIRTLCCYVLCIRRIGTTARRDS